MTKRASSLLSEFVDPDSDRNNYHQRRSVNEIHDDIDCVVSQAYQLLNSVTLVGHKLKDPRMETASNAQRIKVLASMVTRRAMMLKDAITDAERKRAQLRNVPDEQLIHGTIELGLNLTNALAQFDETAMGPFQELTAEIEKAETEG